MQKPQLKREKTKMGEGFVPWRILRKEFWFAWDFIHESLSVWSFTVGDELIQVYASLFILGQSDAKPFSSFVYFLQSNHPTNLVRKAGLKNNNVKGNDMYQQQKHKKYLIFLCVKEV